MGWGDDVDEGAGGVDGHGVALAEGLVAQGERHRQAGRGDRGVDQVDVVDPDRRHRWPPPSGRVKGRAATFVTVRSGSGHRRLAVAAALVGMLLGVLLHDADLRLAAEAGSSGHRSAAVLDTRPLGVDPVAIRTRTSLETELTTLVPTPERRLAAAALGLLAGALAVAALWHLSRPDRRQAPPLHGSAFAALRAPPALTLP